MVGRRRQSLDKTVERLAMPEENISTLLCYLEEGDTPYVKLDNPIYSRARCCVTHLLRLLQQLHQLRLLHPLRLLHLLQVLC